MSSMAVTPKSLWLYGLMALPMAFAGFPLYVLAPDFYATQHGVSLTLLGALLLSIRLVDAVQDPLMGWLIDRQHGRFGLFMIIGGIVLCLALAGLFNVVLISAPVWFLLCTLLAVTAHSLLGITLGAQATLWTRDPNDQTRIAGAREAFGLIGLVIAVSLPSLLSKTVPKETVFLWYSGILVVLMLLGVWAFLTVAPTLRRARQQTEQQTKDTPEHGSIFLGLRALPVASLRLFFVYGVSMLASSIPAVLVIFYVRDLLGAEDLTGPFLLLYFLSGALGMPLWKKISVRHGKHRAWFFSKILAVLGFAGAFFLGAGDVWPYAMVCVVSGMALGADLTLPPSLLSDDIHHHQNHRFSGIHYACLAFMTKASLALASVVALPLLDVAGFKPQAVNTPEALGALSLGYAFIPCLLKLIAAGFLYGFFIRTSKRTV